MKNIFSLHRDIMSDYKLYIDSFINIADKRIHEKVNEMIASGSLYPDPLIQFNPTFESGGTVDDLVRKGVLVREFNNIFYDKNGKSWSIYKHQTEAIETGNLDKGFIVTSGTGSGKSLTYISTVFNYLFRNPVKPGIKAIIVYPLNALINSQEAALKAFNENYKKRTGKDLPFTFAKYTGQEKQADREKIISSPPDIILTNYMMLELLMVRKTDEIVRASLLENLKFLVFDELHFYKGRQGADVSLLIRRIKTQATNKNITCIGTSATMSTGSVSEQKEKVASVASQFFDASFTPEQVIVESLSYSTADIIPDENALRMSVLDKTDITERNMLIKNPIAIWIERKVAIMEDDRHKVRNRPLALKEIAAKLSLETGLAIEICEQKIIETLIIAEKFNIKSALENNRETILPFKLHQFISQTGFVYLTLQDEKERYISLNPNPSTKLHGSEEEVPVFQTVFSRITGHEFICVRKEIDSSGERRFIVRDFEENLNPKNDEDLKINDGRQITRRQREEDEYKDGYLVLNKEFYFNPEEFIDILPSSWVTKSGKIDPDKAHFMPRLVFIQKDGTYSNKDNGGLKAWFLAAPLHYDPTCGVLYQEPKLSEKSKLISLGNEGRSTSTTIITLQTLLALYKHERRLEEQKLMSFTDNRQDASLQAGHFNDFIQVVHLRSAIEKVLKEETKGLTIIDLVYKVQDKLNLQESEYAQNPSPNPAIPSESNREALRNYLKYRIIQDLKRGWRYVLPNLEQTAQLKIDYMELDRYCDVNSYWTDLHLLDQWAPNERKEFLIQILDFFRNSYAVDFEMLRYENRSRIQDILNNSLNKEKLWSLDQGEKIEAPTHLSVDGAVRAPREIYIQSIGSRSRLARFINHEFRKEGFAQLKGDDYKSYLRGLLQRLTELHYLKTQPVTVERRGKDGNTEPHRTDVYQLILDKVIWLPGDEKTATIDKTLYTQLTEEHEINVEPHRYFQKMYKEDYSRLPKSFIAAEHTGQIDNDLKIEREEKFNKAVELSALYCSPTMELGIDISSLNIVHMRNVPPTPANYAQRSGRAGRSGQSAIVFTYASNTSPHDKHFFNDPVRMVSGVVQAPRIDLSNEELVRTHINATVLSFLNAEEFKPSIIELIDYDNRTYKLKPELKAKYQDVIDSRFSEITSIVRCVLSSLKLFETNWYNDAWLETQIRTVPSKLDDALLRWRKMYLDAVKQMNEAHEVKMSPVIKDPEIKKNADRSYYMAQNRINLLANNQNDRKNKTLSEFYTFRYLASEGFLPGYNFTRLPIRAFLGSRDRNEAISRPRFIGIREFGPNNIIYHNGGKYKVTRVTPNDVAMELNRIKISTDTHYAFLGDEGKSKNQDPITGVQFTASNLELHENLLVLDEVQTENLERISCMEEVRSSEGFIIDLYLNSQDDLRDATKIKLTVNEQELMKLFFVPSANLISLNKKWRHGRENGFDIGQKSGFFKTKKQKEKQPTEDKAINVMLYTYDTSDILYIQPVKSLNLDDSGIITLQYAIEKAVEQLYNIEPVEINAKVMGSGENKNIMLYESTEGSIGVLKDISRYPVKIREIFKLAYTICGFDIVTNKNLYPEKPKASYEDLLSYYNQNDHKYINRHSIKNALELLMLSTPDDVQDGTYEEKYEKLKSAIHPQSPGEGTLLDYLFNNGFRLPDYTNYNMEKYYVQPDFVYEKERAVIFVDGGIHKNSSVRASDDQKRRQLEVAGFDVLVWDYTTESAERFVASRQDIFRKVR